MGTRPVEKESLAGVLHMVLINHSWDKLGTQASLLPNVKSNLDLTGLCCSLASAIPQAQNHEEP